MHQAPATCYAQSLTSHVLHAIFTTLCEVPNLYNIAQTGTTLTTQFLTLFPTQTTLAKSSFKNGSNHLKGHQVVPAAPSGGPSAQTPDPPTFPPQKSHT